jgi:hypothetical protein
MRRAAPAPPNDDLFERLASRKTRRQQTRRLGTIALVVVVLGGTALGFVALDRAFTGPAQSPDSPTPSASPSPTPSPSPSETAEGRDIGLAFRVCSVERLGGLSLLSDGTDVAWTGQPVKDTGSCGTATIVAVDATGDGLADAWTEAAVNCRYTGCAPLGSSDLDADGDGELMIHTYFSIVDHFYYSITRSPDGYSIDPILVAAPGDPAADVFPGEPLVTSAAGDEGFAGWMRCEGYPDNPVLVWTWVWGGIDGPTKEWHETRIQLQGDGMFHVIGTNDQVLPAEEDPGFVRWEAPACGINFHYW